MKLQQCLLALFLAAFMTFAYSAPDKAQRESPAATQEQVDDPIAKYASPGEEAVGDLLLQAMSLIGVAYRFGGNSPTSGLDCSGFIQYVFRKSLNVNLPRTSAEMARVGRNIDKSELNPGDLVFFNTRGFQYSHVGIYLGGGKFIHSPRTGKNIEVSNMNQSYWTSRYNGARRVARGAAGSRVDDEAPVSKLAAPAAEPKSKSARKPEAAPAKSAKGKQSRERDEERSTAKGGKKSSKKEDSKKESGKKSASKKGADKQEASKSKKSPPKKKEATKKETTKKSSKG